LHGHSLPFSFHSWSPVAAGAKLQGTLILSSNLVLADDASRGQAATVVGGGISGAEALQTALARQLSDALAGKSPGKATRGDAVLSFESMPGCSSMELLFGMDPNAGGLVDAGALSRWKSQDELTAAIESRAVAESMVRILPFLQLEPVIRMFEVVE